MEKLILIIVFLLLCPSLILVEEKGGISDESVMRKAGNQYNAGLNIGHSKLLLQY